MLEHSVTHKKTQAKAVTQLQRLPCHLIKLSKEELSAENVYVSSTRFQCCCLSCFLSIFFCTMR